MGPNKNLMSRYHYYFSDKTKQKRFIWHRKTYYDNFIHDAI